MAEKQKKPGEEVVEEKTEKVDEVNKTEPAEGTEAKDLAKLVEGVDIEELLKVPAVASALKDRVASQTDAAVKTAKAGWQEEADALAGMSEEEKAQYLFRKEKEDFEKAKLDLARQRRAITVKAKLEEAGLPDLSEFITADDDETTTANLATVTSILSAWKAKQLAGVMRGEAQEDVGVEEKTTLTADDIAKMSRAEIREAIRAGRIDYSKL